MKIVSKKILQIADVEMTRRLRLDSLVNILQEAAIQHTRRAGMELHTLLDSGKTWVLNKLAVELNRLPHLDDELEIHTWSRSIKRIKGIRDFEIFCCGEKICAASSVWIYLDINKKRPVRVPAEYEELYGVDAARALELDLDDWRQEALSHRDFSYSINTRVSDFDINGHVNNAVSLQYVQTAIFRAFGGRARVAGFRLSYLQEISQQIEVLEVKLQVVGDIVLFEISAEDVVYMAGEIDVCDSSVPQSPPDLQ